MTATMRGQLLGASDYEDTDEWIEGELKVKVIPERVMFGVLMPSITQYTIDGFEVDPETISEVVKAHLPGKHDQATHGHGGSAAESAANAEFRKRMESTKVISSEPLGGGLSGHIVVRETRDDGSQTVRKIYSEPKAIRSQYVADSISEEIDRDVLSSEVAQSLGFEDAVVIQIGDNETLQPFHEGMTGERFMHMNDTGPEGYARIDAVVKGPQGQQMAILDAVIANEDRNDGNFLIKDNGKIVPIDHGLAQYTTEQPRDFFSIFEDENQTHGGYSRSNLSQATISTARERLVALAPVFEARGRSNWHESMLMNLDAIVPNGEN